MPFVANMDSEEQKTDPTLAPQGAVSPVGGNAPVRLSPSSAVAPTGGGAGGTPGSAPTPAAGGQFASLQNYITANQGQAAPLAGKLASGINQEYSNLDTANNTAIANINQQVTNAPGYTPSNPSVMSAEAANPSSFASTPGNVASFQSLLQNTYGGPTSAEGTSDYANRQNAINQAIATGTNQTTTEAGRENLLSQNEAAPTTGVTALNSAILSQDPNALASIENAYQPFGNLLTNLQTGAASVDKTIAQEQADAAASAQAANQQISSQINALNTGVSGELATAQQNAAAQNAQVKADLLAGTPTTTDLQALGMTPDQWNSLSAADKAAATSQVVSSNQKQFMANTGTTTIDPTQFLTQTNPNQLITAANVATPQDYANAQAFQTLLQGLNLQTPTAIINPSTASQAGTAPTSFNTFDYQTALNTAQQAKTSEVAAAQAYVDALQAGADEQHAQLEAQKAAQKSTLYGMGTLAAGTTIPATAGYASGISDATKGAIQNPSLAHSADILNALTGPKAIASTAKGIEQGVVGAVNTITNIFCFHPDTMIVMEDESLLPIHKIEVGDMTKGGKVLATTRAIGQDFYWYNGVVVTAKHAVKEDGRWVRVENSRLGHRFKYLTEVVCNLVTEKHRIFANGIEFADQHETDLYEYVDLDQSLALLNKNADHLG